ncbi:hypothetical protein A3850_003210 [Lewinella sp. 4G2]|nr:hypothetical protein A3850_003210 [Lewinella sp. 4G2]
MPDRLKPTVTSNCHAVPKQSTRHKYKSRREKDAERFRIGRILGYGLLIFAILMLIRNWEDYYNYLRTYWM